MDHAFAEKTGAADRYLLDEFTLEERVEFEDHYFDCADCSDQVRKGAIFIETARDVLRAERPNEAIANVGRPRNRSGLLEWLKAWLFNPMQGLPALAALGLAMVVGYQNLATIPALVRPELMSDMVIAPMTRGKTPVVPIDRRKALFNLNFDADSPHVYTNYTCLFRNEKGITIMTLESGPREESSFRLSWKLPAAKFPAGQYEMILSPRGESNNIIERYVFAISNGDSIR
jgi:hypothetical protein